jgi:UDP-N-acetylmuramate dehydrogenase
MTFELQYNVSLAEYVSWKSGGHAKVFFQPTSIENLAAYLQQLPTDEPVLFLGLGSNLLVRDGGFDGTVIFTQKYLRQLRLENDNGQVFAECGVACPTLARFAIKHHLTGGEWFAGVPGTVGGALAMNAGAFGGETWGHVVSVHCLDRQGKLYIRKPEDFQISYRTVVSPREEWFVGASFQFAQGDKNTALDKVNQLLTKRAATQPTGLPSCGSVFRNPPNDHAARLIEACGLKAYRIGQAVVSEKHANFIINEGNASAHDIEALIKYVAQQVFEKQGVRLQPEVKIIGKL